MSGLVAPPPAPSAPRFARGRGTAPPSGRSAGWCSGFGAALWGGVFAGFLAGSWRSFFDGAGAGGSSGKRWSMHHYPRDPGSGRAVARPDVGGSCHRSWPRRARTMQQIRFRQEHKSSGEGGIKRTELRCNLASRPQPSYRPSSQGFMVQSASRVRLSAYEFVWAKRGQIRGQSWMRYTIATCRAICARGRSLRPSLHGLRIGVRQPFPPQPP